MNRTEATRICNRIESIATQNANFGTVRWTHCYDYVEQIVEDLKKIVIPTDGGIVYGLYRGYEYIHSFAKRVQNGNDLTEKQLSQCKRLALEIKKAAAIADCY